MSEIMIVRQIKIGLGRDYLLLYEDKAPTNVFSYYVIASIDEDVKVGDIIEYEDDGPSYDYGYFIRKVVSEELK